MNRFGGSRIVALLMLVALAAAGYYGIEIGGVYWRKFRLEDAVSQQLSNAGQVSVDGVRQRILEEIRGMNLPPQASRFSLTSTDRPRSLQFSTSYSETVNLLFTTKQISVTVRSSRRF